MRQRSARWAIRFADLTLLLLGFFVLLQASGSRSAQVLSGVGVQFGATPMAKADEWRADMLFVPGEAMLTEKGMADIKVAAQRALARGGTVDLASAGQDRGTHRFDSWDLAAARLGAVARALKEAGISEDALIIRGLDQRVGEGKGQVIRLAPGAQKTR